MKSLKELSSLQGRVAVVTGGGGHIGGAMCEALAELGAAVAIVDLAEESCTKTAKRIDETYNIKTLPLAVDIVNEELALSIPKTVVDRFGRLDILVNCAALVGTSDLKGWAVPFLEQRSSTWRLALEVNLTAAFVLAQACSEALAAHSTGSIINIGSTYGMVGPDMNLYQDTDLGNPAAYAASKGGVLQLTRWLATTLAPRVRVNSISPGGVWRNQPESFHQKYVSRTPMGRMATEEDLKGALAFLASDLSSYVTGHNLVVDGGWTAW